MSDKTILSMDVQFKQVFAQVVLEQKAQYDAWASALKARGVKAAMPDDGWVDAKDKCLHFAYPTFQVGMAPIQKGYLVALGWPDRYRLVKLTGRTKKRFIPGSPIWWYYEDINETKNG